MAKQPTYPVGSTVKIKDPGKKPSNWNGDMMRLVGVTTTIRRIEPPTDKDSYMYNLKGWQWTWRHRDLELIELPKLDPNREFRNKKYGI